jgi:hypothetical protein
MSTIRTAVLSAALALAAGAAEAALFFPSSYRSAADSPFAGKAVLDYSHLDDFETASRAPGYGRSGGIILGPGPLTDSVDGDDGAIDGSGNGGRSLYSDGANRLVFTFDAATLGRLPTHAGIVWTDVGFATPVDLIGDVTFEAYDAAGALIDGLTAHRLGDGSAGGGTAEDRFFGIAHLAGIARIEIAMPGSTDWEVDHLQYAVLTPVPAALPLLAAGLGGLALLARRRTRA